jgi:hypothetical protein
MPIFSKTAEELLAVRDSRGKKSACEDLIRDVKTLFVLQCSDIRSL